MNECHGISDTIFLTLTLTLDIFGQIFAYGLPYDFVGCLVYERMKRIVPFAGFKVDDLFLVFPDLLFDQCDDFLPVRTMAARTAFLCIPILSVKG